MDFSGRSIAVIGDVMLDRYIRGVCERVSPEAPVPVVWVENEEAMLGGAGNVAANLASLGCRRVALFGAVGNDKDGVEVAAEAERLGIEAHLTVSESCCTTTKTRIIANGQQVVRFDNEDCSNDIGAEMIMENIGDVDAVILSDYGKGALTHGVCQGVIRNVRAPVFVDPKDGDWRKYSGAFCVKPNRYELDRQVNMAVAPDCYERCLGELSVALDVQAFLLTVGSAGMLLWRRSWKRAEYIPALDREVFDVSGAGDTAIAVFAASQHMGIVDAAKLANAAAGIVVSKRGTATVSADELMEIAR